MNIKNRFGLLLVVIVSQTLMACAQSLPDDLDQSSKSEVLQAGPANTALPLDLMATSYNLQLGNQASLSASGGTPPYAYSMSGAGAGTISVNVFTATAAGNVTITVTDAAGLTKSLDILVAPAAGPGVVVVEPLPPIAPATVMSTDFSQLGAIPNTLPRYKMLANAEPGSIPLYLCSIDYPVLQIFNGTAGNCANTTFVIGHIYTTQKPGTVPLYRVKMNRISGNAISGGINIYVVNAEATSIPAPWTDGGILGYVPQ